MRKIPHKNYFPQNKEKPIVAPTGKPVVNTPYITDFPIISKCRIGTNPNLLEYLELTNTNTDKSACIALVKLGADGKPFWRYRDKYDSRDYDYDSFTTFTAFRRFCEEAFLT